jgi:hypothetical protein
MESEDWEGNPRRLEGWEGSPRLGALGQAPPWLSLTPTPSCSPPPPFIEHHPCGFP